METEERYYNVWRLRGRNGVTSQLDDYINVVFPVRQQHFTPLIIEREPLYVKEILGSTMTRTKFYKIRKPDKTVTREWMGRWKRL